MAKWWMKKSRWVRFVMVLGFIGVLMIHPLTRIPVLLLIPVGPGINEFIFIAAMALVGVTVVVKVFIEYLTGKRNSLFRRKDSVKLLAILMTDVKWYLEKHPEDIKLFNNTYLESTGQTSITDSCDDIAKKYT